MEYFDNHYDIEEAPKKKSAKKYNKQELINILAGMSLENVNTLNKMSLEELTLMKKRLDLKQKEQFLRRYSKNTQTRLYEYDSEEESITL